MASVKEELSKLFERLNDFTKLGEDYSLSGDIARNPKLLLAKQISETFVTKDAQKEKSLMDWLRSHVAEARVVEAKEAKNIQDWDEFVYFKRRYSRLLKTVIRELGIFGNHQEWLDVEAIVNSLNKINLEETWGRGRVASAAVLAALKTVVKTSSRV